MVSSDQHPLPTIDLERFLRAQELNYAQALAELQAGRKETHWIWYVLPQLRGLGRSHTAREYGISGRAEASAYLEHPVLGARLVECVNALMRHPGRSAAQMLGEVDAMKFRSCLSLFVAVSPAHPAHPVMNDALMRFFGGVADAQTRRLLDLEHQD